MGADVVDEDHVVVAQAGHGLGLAQEASAAGGVAGEGLVEQLDRQPAAESLVDGRVDHAHGAGTEPALDAIAADPHRRAGLAEQALGDLRVHAARLEVAVYLCLRRADHQGGTIATSRLSSRCSSRHYISNKQEVW